jgi:hypothetical protein
MEFSDTGFDIASTIIWVLVRYFARIFPGLPEEAKPVSPQEPEERIPGFIAC